MYDKTFYWKKFSNKLYVEFCLKQQKKTWQTVIVTTFDAGGPWNSNSVVRGREKVIFDDEEPWKSNFIVRRREKVIWTGTVNRKWAGDRSQGPTAAAGGSGPRKSNSREIQWRSFISYIGSYGVQLVHAIFKLIILQKQSHVHVI